ncbi:cell envelope-related function transcriptional attenuator common domain [Rhodoluna lacicola]|uniref:Cell envelope-related function transcriptional attenuator common domain n=2 Tax=Rhodoluna lacicola TaxID=529884 RepID=A0A060JGQ6_9MICO|nr:cell envelope-related function transcriptional attenuator common domain [Rhodoluna lacicola]
MHRRAWWLLLLTVLVPGSAQLVAGNKKLARVGISATIGFWIFFLLLVVIGLINRSWVIWLVTLPVLIWVLSAALIGYSILFAILTLDTLRLMRLGRLYSRERWITFGAVVLAGIFGTSAISYAGNLAGVQANFIGSIFNQGGFTSPVDGRYNIMLLGADAGADRFGIRPDSISVISIDAATGQTVNIGIPRNMQHVGFSSGSPMNKIYPNGWNCGIDCLINAIYKDAEDNHADAYPDAAKKGSTPGTEATRDAVEYVTGLQIQSYVLVDMASFTQLIDALGGITINVKERLPIGGQRDDLSDVKGWIEAGKQHMDGYTALWYARSRHSTSDYDRMRRQHEVEQAVLSQIEPATVLTRFQQIASAGQKLVRTDIPSPMLAQYVELAGKARAIGIQELSLVPPKIDVIHPNFSAIHEMVKRSFATTNAAGEVKE